MLYCTGLPWAQAEQNNPPSAIQAAKGDRDSFLNRKFVLFWVADLREAPSLSKQRIDPPRAPGEYGGHMAVGTDTSYD